MKITIERDGKETEVIDDLHEFALVGFGIKDGLAYFNVMNSCTLKDRAHIIGKLYEMIERLRDRSRST